MPSTALPLSMRTWRRPPLFRYLFGGGLFATAVSLGVFGQWMLSGALSLVMLTVSALCLLASALALFSDYQGDITLDPDGIVLSDGQRLQSRRIRGCDLRPGPGGTSDLVIALASPDEERVVPTGQPRAAVRRFVDAVEAVTG